MNFKGTVRRQFLFFVAEEILFELSYGRNFLIHFSGSEHSDLCRNIFPAECHHLTNFKQSLSYNESHTKEKEGETCTMNFI